MKKLYFLMVALMVTGLSYGQSSDLYFSMYGEGSSNNKFFEIYNGTGSDVDLVDYSLELYANGATSPNNTLTFSTGTIITDGDVYVIYNSSSVTGISDNGDISATVTFYNGDDALALLKNGTAIDIIGVIGEDPGSAWDVAGVAGATANHTMTRKSIICDPTTDWAASAGTDADSSQWAVTDIDTEWGNIGSFTGCSANTTLSISSPTEATVFSPETTAVDVALSVQNFAVANGTGDGYILWDLNGGAPTDKFDTDPIALTGLTPGDYNIFVELLDNYGASLDPAVEADINFTITSYTQVADLATLRAGILGNYYEVTGEVIGTYAQSYNNQKWAQDASAGILINDPDDIIVSVYNEFDGVTGLKGQLDAYNGLLQIIPSADPGAATSTGNTITPEVVTIATLNANLADYESELIEILAADIADSAGGDGTFQTGTNYNITDATATGVLRTNFYGADYIGTALPATATNYVCLVGSYNDIAQVTPRALGDMVLGISQQTIEGFGLFPNPVTNGVLTITTQDNLEKSIQIFDVLGKQVFTKTTSTSTINVSNLNAGIYIIKVEEAGRLATRKLVIE